MVHIRKASVQLKPDNVCYQTILNAKYIDQTYDTIIELGNAKEDTYTYEYELSNKILVILWK